jgi:predicted metalloprotease with PDZ domain
MKFARLTVLLSAWLICAWGPAFAAGRASPVSYAIQISDPASQTVEVEATFPVQRVEETLYMPVWTPGYYVKEDYKKNIVSIEARDDKGAALAVADLGANRWSVRTRGSGKLIVRYVLSAKERSVSRNEVAPTYAVLNGSATYITVKGDEDRAQEVALALPKGWRSATGLRAVGGSDARRFAAANYEELVDSPIMAGDLEILEFTSRGTSHQIAYNHGAVAVDKARLVSDLETMTNETRDFWGAKPWRRYAFLIAFRNSGGGLEHAHSTLVNVNPERFAATGGYDAFLALIAHEYQHAFNVKRLRPVELQAFDYETPPTLATLWISEGLTSYYSNLMLRRSGLISVDRYLAGLSKQITALQTAPGRLKQSLEQSSLGVWSNSNSGVGVSDATVSYYIKGEVAGFLLDARIREASGDRASLDQVMREAYRRYSGETGFRLEDFARLSSQAAGRPLDDWFAQVVKSPGEVDYQEALSWYGLTLRRAAGDGGTETFALSASADADSAQQRHLKAWLD